MVLNESKVIEGVYGYALLTSNTEVAMEGDTFDIYTRGSLNAPTTVNLEKGLAILMFFIQLAAMNNQGSIEEQDEDEEICWVVKYEDGSEQIVDKFADACTFLDNLIVVISY